MGRPKWSSVALGWHRLVMSCEAATELSRPQRNSAGINRNATPPNAQKLSSLVPLVVDLLINRSTVAALLLQLVGHVLLWRWPSTVSKDFLTADFEQHFRLILASGGLLGRLLWPSGGPWSVWGASGPLLGRSWAAPGPSWGPLGAPLGASWAPLGRSGAAPRLSWWPLEALRGPSWRLLERSGRLQSCLRPKP